VVVQAQREALAAAAKGCPRVVSVSGEAKLRMPELRELSGLAASRRQPGVLWVHNDSGDRARIYAIGMDGRKVAEVTLSGVRARDFEDIARGPGPTPDRDLLYVADTGDGDDQREDVQIHSLLEPQVDASKSLQLESKVSTLTVRYEDGPHDVETLLVDPQSGDLYLVEKGFLLFPDRLVTVHRVPAAAGREGSVTAQPVAQVPMGPATGGDVRADGSGIAIRSYWKALYWHRRAGEALETALSRSACELELADRGEQGEALGFAADGASYITIAEGRGAAIFRYQLAP
jgi:hypothetical protein